MLETFNLLPKSTQTHFISENIPYSTRTSLILPIEAFLLQNSSIFGKNSIFTQGNDMKAVLKTL